MTQTIDTPDPLVTALRELARSYDGHAERIAVEASDPTAGEPLGRAAAQLRLVAVLFIDEVYDRVTAYVWLQAGRRMLDELTSAWMITVSGR